MDFTVLKGQSSKMATNNILATSTSLQAKESQLDHEMTPTTHSRPMLQIGTTVRSRHANHRITIRSEGDSGDDAVSEEPSSSLGAPSARFSLSEGQSPLGFPTAFNTRGFLLEQHQPTTVLQTAGERLFRWVVVSETIFRFLPLEDQLRCRLISKPCNALLLSKETRLLTAHNFSSKLIKQVVTGNGALDAYCRSIRNLMLWTVLMMALYFAMSFIPLNGNFHLGGDSIPYFLVFVVVVFNFTIFVPPTVFGDLLIQQGVRRGLLLKAVGYFVCAPLAVASAFIAFKASEVREWSRLDTMPVQYAECPPDPRTPYPGFVQFHDPDKWWVEPTQHPFKDVHALPGEASLSHYFRWAYYNGTVEELLHFTTTPTKPGDVASIPCSRQYSIDALLDGTMHMTIHNVPTDYQLLHQHLSDAYIISEMRRSFNHSLYMERQQQWLAHNYETKASSRLNFTMIAERALFVTAFPRIPVYDVTALNDEQRTNPGLFRTVFPATMSEGSMDPGKRTNMYTNWFATYLGQTLGYPLVTRDGRFPLSEAKQQLRIAYTSYGCMCLLILLLELGFFISWHGGWKSYQALLSILKQLVSTRSQRVAAQEATGGRLSFSNEQLQDNDDRMSFLSPHGSASTRPVSRDNNSASTGAPMSPLWSGEVSEIDFEERLRQRLEASRPPTIATTSGGGVVDILPERTTPQQLRQQHTVYTLPSAFQSKDDISAESNTLLGNTTSTSKKFL